MNSSIKVEPSILSREFNAPRQLVFDAWTQVEHLTQWMFPMQGCKCEYVSADIKTGGSSLHKVIMPNGHEMFLLTKFEEVSSPDKIVFLQYMSNAEGEIVPSNHMPNWPKDMRATVLLEGDGDKTQLTFLWEPVNPTKEEAEAFEASRSEHGKGWGAGLEQLHLYLSAK